MDAAEIRQARQLRDAYQGALGQEIDEKAIEGDYIDVRARITNHGVQTFVCIWLDGRQVARAPLGPGAAKKFRRELQKIKNIDHGAHR